MILAQSNGTTPSFTSPYGVGSSAVGVPSYRPVPIAIPSSMGSTVPNSRSGNNRPFQALRADSLTGDRSRDLELLLGCGYDAAHADEIIDQVYASRGQQNNPKPISLAQKLLREDSNSGSPSSASSAAKVTPLS